MGGAGGGFKPLVDRPFEGAAAACYWGYQRKLATAVAEQAGKSNDYC
jgi:hypothetical protein